VAVEQNLYARLACVFAFGDRAELEGGIQPKVPAGGDAVPRQGIGVALLAGHGQRTVGPKDSGDALG
jgi:hypothetical protein